MFRNADVVWVLLAGGMWYPVVAGSFELELAREWSSQHGSFGYGYHFTAPDGHFYGPLSGLVAVVVPR